MTHIIRITTVIGFATAGIVVSGSAVAYTTTYQASGNMCQPYYSYPGAAQTLLGTVNEGSNGAWVTCPMPATYSFSGGGPFTAADVQYDDASTTDYVECYPFGYNPGSGSYAFGATIYSCSSGGGCSSPTSSFTGRSSFDWYPGSFSVTLTGFNAYSNISFICYLPPSSTIYGYTFLD
jgi:hypothetical protein